MMVTQVLTYPYILIVIEDNEIHTVDGIISDGIEDAIKETTISTAGAAILPGDVTDMSLYSLMGEKVKTYAPEEFPLIVEAFNNAIIDDSFYIEMITGNRLTISLSGGAAIEMTMDPTNIVAVMRTQEENSEVRSWHLV